MGFNTANGTRGARQPKAGRLTKWFNEWNAKKIRRGGGRIMGMDVLVLTTVGARSGVARENPTAWFPGGNDDSWLIVASAAGAPKNPAWYFNIKAHPDEVTIELAGQKIQVSAEQLGGAERVEAWRRITEAVPRFAGYETKTDREIPVIRLTRRAG